jgi:2-octaprenyl-6-methoxyphenol hydroxylase
VTIKDLSQENFHKICVVGGGITGAVMVLLLKNSNMFKLNEIGWIKPKLKSKYDFRTTFYNETSLKLLNNLNILKKLKNNDYTSVKNIKVFGPNFSSPLEWNYFDTKRELGAVIKNDIVLNIIEDKLKDIKQYDSFVNNTECKEFERTLYLENKTFINTHLVLSADGKNSYLRKLLSVKTIKKNTKHIAISGFLKQSKNHNSTAIQAFTKIGPIGILPYENKNLVNFVQSIEKVECKKILSKENPEYFICNELNKFFSHIDLNFSPINKINKIENKLSFWDLDLNMVLNPTSSRAILIGDSAHSIHPLAGQGLNLSLRDCGCALNAIENCLKFGNDLGDESILDFYKRERLPKNISMTAFTDLIFFGFTSTSNKTQSLLTKGMENLNKTNLKNIFRDLASI